MKVSELKDGLRRVDITGMVTVVDEKNRRTVNLRSGGSAEVAEVTLSDESGDIPLVLWDAQINGVKKGTEVQIKNGYVNSYNGTVKLNVGKYGELEILETNAPQSKL
jgi:replication factor A1